MDKVSTRFTRGRLKIAVLIAVCLIAIVALPATAFAATVTNQSPVGTLNAQPAVVGAIVSSGTAMDLRGASITIGGVAQPTYVVEQGAILGQWTQSEVLQPDGSYRIRWTWTDAAADASKATVYCYAPKLGEGAQAVVLTAAGASASWSYTLQTRPSFGDPTPANGGFAGSLPTISIPWSASAASGATDVILTIHYNQATQSGDFPVDIETLGATSGVATFVWNMDPLVGAQSVTATIVDGSSNVLATKNWSFNTPATPVACTQCHEGYETAPAMGSNCALCHSDTAPHTNYNTNRTASEFDTGQASRHNVNQFGYGGNRGALEWFDGREGVVLKEAVTAANSTEDTITVEWALPEVNVFWASDAKTTGQAPASAIVGLDWDSVVGCKDCHAGFTSPAGPQGASVPWGMDPAYPAPYKYAILGANKGTTMATSTSGIKFRTSRSDAKGYTDTSPNSSIADGTQGANAVICAKCHDLFNAGTGCDGWSNAYSEQSTIGAEPLLDEASPESIHGMHAGGTNTTATSVGNQGRNDGRSDCVQCHIGVPHGWKRPRLLVNGYNGDYIIGGGLPSQPGYSAPTTVTSVADPAPYWIGRGQTMANGNSPGNGPIDALEAHELNTVQRVPVWSEQRCISCSGSATGNSLEHGGFTTSPAKLK